MVALLVFQEGFDRGRQADLIGGDAAGASNVVSGNDRIGVYIVGSDATGNQVKGNLIGTDSSGIADVGNTLDGVVIQDAPNNTVGGASPGAGNVV